MAIEQLEYCTAETNVIASLADKPNAQSGMTAAQVKAKFDAADAAIKGYINDTLVPYVNNNLGAMDTKLGEHDEGIDALETDRHTHGNKELLDSYTQTEANLADAVSKKHEHTNKTKLDTYDKTQTELLQLGCNPNLLDNWYFPKPVNQRGASSYSAAGYGIDRWIIESGASITLSSEGLMITSASNMGIVQKYETPARINGKTGTVSLLLSNGALDAYTFTLGSLSGGQRVGEYDIYSTESAMLYVRATDATQHAIVAVKLELGSQQTLCHKDASGNWALNEVPNYAEQLARCQRYFLKLPSGYGTCHYLYGRGVVMPISTPVAMRTKPTVTVATARVFAASPQVAWYDLPFYGTYAISASQYDLSFSSTGGATLNYGDSYLIQIAAELSAEL